MEDHTHPFTAKHPNNVHSRSCVRCGRLANHEIHAHHTPEETRSSARQLLIDLMASYPSNTREYAALLKATQLLA